MEFTNNNLRQVNDDFNSRLKNIIGGSNNNYKPLELGKPGEVLISVGIPYLPIQMTVQRLIDKKLQSTHPFKLLSVVHMPDYIANPVAIFQSKTRYNSKVILTEMEHNSVNMIVAVELNRFSGKEYVNSVRSVYPKDNFKDILKWVVIDKLLEYCHQKKFLYWLSKQQSNSADVTQLIEDTVKIVNSYKLKN